ncbi:hypothetical protein V6C27_14400 [Peptococcaceae bacterium 1198_IL3148]
MPKEKKFSSAQCINEEGELSSSAIESSSDGSNSSSSVSSGSSNCPGGKCK